MNNKLALIEAVKQYPILYKKQYKKIPSIERDSCWVAISVKLGISESRCLHHWRKLRNAYVRSKKRGCSPTKYDEALSFLDPEINDEKESILEMFDDINQEFDPELRAKGNSLEIVSTNQSKSPNVTHDTVTVLSSDEDESPEGDKEPSGYSIKIQPRSSSSEAVVSLQKDDIEIYGVHSANTLQKLKSVTPQEPRVYIFGSHLIKKDNADQYPKTINLMKDLENVDTVSNSSNAKRFKPSSSNYVQTETSTIKNFPNENNENKQVCTPNTEIPSVPTKESVTDIKTFFSELSSHIKSKFSLQKQKDLQLQIYSLLTTEELKRMQTQ